jgi:hypothetical protein
MLKRLAIQILFILPVAPAAWAASPAPAGELKVTTKRVVIFKNGHGLFLKEAAGRTGADGTVFTEQVPDAASLGSFWVSDRATPPEAVIASRAVRTDRQALPAKAQNVFEVLVANRGKQARVLTEDKQQHQGVIRQVLENGPDPDPPPDAGRPSEPVWSYSAHGYDSRLGIAVPRPAGPEPVTRRPTGAFFILDTADGDLLIAVADVRRLSVEGMATELSQERVTRREVKLLTVRYPERTEGAAHQLDLIYFRPGIRWIPSYRIDLTDGGAADLVMQAEVINEAEDFEDAAVDFVVGLPTFRFQDVASPMSLEQVMLDTLARAAPQVMGQLAAQSFSNAVFDNYDRGAQQGRVGRAALPAGMDAAVDAMAGAELQDLYYYSTRKMSLKQGERAVVEVLRTRLPFRHLYTWDLELGQAASAVRTADTSPLRTSRNKVWHQIVLENQSGRPLTTGPALILERGLPLGQDMLTFTPNGREVHLPVTAAVSVRGVLEQDELSRTASARRLHGDSYALVRNRARFRVTNSLKVPVRLQVRAEVAGKCTRVSAGGQVVQVGQAGETRGGLVPRSRVTWDLEIPAGADETVEARYFFYLAE